MEATFGKTGKAEKPLPEQAGGSTYPGMQTQPLFILVCAAALVLPFSALAQDAKKYQLKLERPDKVGDKSHDEINATLEKSQRVMQQGQVLKEEASNAKVSLTGTLEVLEVNDKGKIKKLQFSVENFTRHEEDGTKGQLLKEGTVITGTAMEGREKNKFEVEGKEVEETTAEILRQLLTMSGADKTKGDDDVIFGAKDPQAPGSEWKVDAKTFVDSMPDEMPFKLEEEGVSGRVKFLAVKTIDGVESCQVQMSVEMRPSSLQGLPPNFKPDKMLFSVNGEKLAPVDPSLPIPYEKLEQKSEVSGEAGPVTVRIYQRTARERTSKPLK
jgi:hypothetical protein